MASHAKRSAWLLVGGVVVACAFLTEGPLTSCLNAAEKNATPTDDPFGGSAGDDPFGGGGSDPFGGGEGADPFAGDGDDPFGGSSPENPFDSNATRPARVEERDRERQRAPATTCSQNPCRQLVIWADNCLEISEHAQKIRRVLDSPLSSAGLDFAGTPLEEVVDFLRDEYEIEIQIDSNALDDIGIGTNESINVNLRNVPLRSALRLMLQQLELTSIIADEVLLITTQEEAESRLTVAVYPVSDLLTGKKELAELIDVLSSTVASETWAVNGGGEAEIRSLSSGLLVVGQTQAVHEELANVLTAIRKAKLSSE